ncbi:hypothetical protein QP794_21160 [Paenibacillus sp. UMB7766-LJ446]|uniref:ABC-three component system middle component 2 n=1 Tax=Paenibacillus sp. UMB7766-LJ446 TaxID=3046313 RepID=UPI00254CFCE5|nr:ABC-three component system middle component 2 [Paenibacillus sp. UMB7766-LJ446]MDK8192600.1 hypothetical protein [Paenibacillus sp. UMB7766-LJ446]
MINEEIRYGEGYNSPFEVGLRTLAIVVVNSPRSLNLQRLIYYDYLILHSNDVGVKNCPPSLHPDIPHRSGGLVVRRQAMQVGLDLMYSKSLIDIIFNNEGVSYAASHLTEPFLDLIISNYSHKLRKNALWVMNHFSEYSEEELKIFIESNIEKWGGEFMYEAYVRSGVE